MKELKELIKVALSKRVGGIETFNHHTADTGTLTYKLFNGIASNRYNTDDDAKKAIYGANHGGKKYNMLKERFKEKLYTNVLFVQPRKKETSSYSHNAYFCHKHYIVGKLLIMIAARKTGRRIMKKVLEKADKYEVFDIAMLAAISLKKQAILVGSTSLFKKYTSLSDHYLEIVAAENKAEGKYNALLINFARSYSLKPEIIEEAKNCFTYIEGLKNTFSTYNIQYNYFLSKKLYLELVHNYAESLQLCKEFEKYLLSKPDLYSNVRHGNICAYILEAFLYTGQYAEGIKLADEASELFDSKEGNWLVLQELHFLHAIKAGSMPDAVEIFKRVTVFLKGDVVEHQKEMWRIFGGYLWLLLQSRNDEKRIEQLFEKNKSFNIGKFMNEVPIFTKDKKAMNLSLNILQFVFFVQKKDFINAIDKAESLRKYVYAYVDRKTGTRDHIFLKLILLLIKLDFNPAIAEKKSNNLIEKLKTISIAHDAYSRVRIEVIQYEVLWQLILKMLK